MLYIILTVKTTLKSALKYIYTIKEEFGGKEAGLTYELRQEIVETDVCCPKYTLDNIKTVLGHHSLLLRVSGDQKQELSLNQFLL